MICLLFLILKQCLLILLLQNLRLSLICDVYEPATKEKYSRCPRNIAQKAGAYLKSTGIADTVYFGPEAEFFVFDDVRFDSQPNGSFYVLIQLKENGTADRDEGPNLDISQDIRKAIFLFPLLIH